MKEESELAESLILAFDLDNTIIGEKDAVYSGVKEALQGFRQNNAMLFIATGRSVTMMKEFMSHHPLAPIFEKQVVCNNGDVIFDMTTLRAEIINSFGDDDSSHFIKTHLSDFEMVIESEGIAYTNSKLAGAKYCRIFQVGRSNVSVLSESNLSSLRSVTEICLFPRGHNSTVAEFEQAVVKKTDYFNSTIVRPINSCKATGLQVVLNRQGLSLSNVIAFGDAENDLTLLIRSAHGYAVKNCRPNIRDRSPNCLTEDIGEFLHKLLQDKSIMHSKS